MAEATVTVSSVVSEVLRALPRAARVPSERYWVDYDRQGDVLYLSFDRPQRATDTRPVGDHFLLRFRGRRMVGVTVLHASSFLRRAA